MCQIFFIYLSTFIIRDSRIGVIQEAGLFIF